LHLIVPLLQARECLLQRIKPASILFHAGKAVHE
jgi:hypothetical protein